MLAQTLRKHQWLAYRRHAMFGRNRAIKVIIYILIGFFGLYFLALGLLLNELLLEMMPDVRPIDAFNGWLLYIFLWDFLLKYMLKKNQSMQILPYLSLPIKRIKLFNFLLNKEFASIWNFYLLFLVLPFACFSIPPYYGWGMALLYVLFFYAMSQIISLGVRLVNDLSMRTSWYALIPMGLVAIVGGMGIFGYLPIEPYMKAFGTALLKGSYVIWAAIPLAYVLLRLACLRCMRTGLYHEAQQFKVSRIASYTGLSFLESFGEVGRFMIMEIKMILRAKRIKTSIFGMVYIVVFGVGGLYLEVYANNSFTATLLPLMGIGAVGLIMGQFLFAAESASFDGLMARNHSMRNSLKAKYYLYVACASVTALLFILPVCHGKMTLFGLIANYFYVTGIFFLLIFQNAVYNKGYIDIFEKGMFSWQGVSGNMMVVTMLTMFMPVVVVLLISSFFSQTIANLFMLGTGLLATIASPAWLSWTYKRFLKRKYKNMEGFRAAH